MPERAHHGHFLARCRVLADHRKPHLLSDRGRLDEGIRVDLSGSGGVRNLGEGDSRDAAEGTGSHDEQGAVGLEPEGGDGGIVPRHRPVRPGVRRGRPADPQGHTAAEDLQGGQVRQAARRQLHRIQPQRVLRRHVPQHPELRDGGALLLHALSAQRRRAARRLRNRRQLFELRQPQLLPVLRGLVRVRRAAGRRGSYQGPL